MLIGSQGVILIRGMQVPAGGKYQGFALWLETGTLGSLVAGLGGSDRLRSNDSGCMLPEAEVECSEGNGGSTSMQSSAGASVRATVSSLKQLSGPSSVPICVSEEAAADVLYFAVSIHMDEGIPFGISDSLNHELSGTYLSCGPLDIQWNIGSTLRPGPAGSWRDSSYGSVIVNWSRGFGTLGPSQSIASFWEVTSCAERLFRRFTTLKAFPYLLCVNDVLWNFPRRR